MHRRQFLATSALVAPALVTPGLIRPARAHESSTTSPTALPGAQAFRIGDRVVTALLDGALRIEAGALQGLDQAAYDELMRAAYRDPASYRSAVNAYLVTGGDETILIDSGTGGAMGPDLGRVAQNLAATGTAPEDVTLILVTHLHPDHFGGMVTDGGAVFPNARVALSEAERAFWTDDGMRAQAPDEMQGVIEMARAALDAYADRLEPFDGEADVAPGITSMPLPGHTPGHAGFMVGDGDEGLLIWADVIHVPPVQFARPDVTIGFDVNPDEAASTRAEIMDRVVSDRLLVAGMHMTFPGLAHVERAADGFRAVAAPYDYLYPEG